jgi:hypothetical protein
MADFMLVPPVILGAIIGIYEIILLHRDVTVPTHRFGHGIHAVIFAIIATFCTMNTPWVFQMFPALSTIPYVTPLIFQVIVGIIAMIKIHGVSAAIKTSVGGISIGLRETWFHSVLIGALIVAAPYAWPFLQPVMPSWAQ